MLVLCCDPRSWALVVVDHQLLGLYCHLVVGVVVVVLLPPLPVAHLVVDVVMMLLHVVVGYSLVVLVV
ncbi:MAG: hypothetical protein DHS20C13_27260 [Thermodesulfobacteriota bacterium]|nr:MAG: hypothetical protein DHS20C13_27260 [Thermodesulfobacteriota bacterium]